MDPYRGGHEPFPAGMGSNSAYNPLFSPPGGFPAQRAPPQWQMQRQWRSPPLNPSRNYGTRYSRHDLVARAEQAASAAYNHALSRGENITVWKVTQSMFGMLQIDSLDAMGLSIQDIPCLYNLILLEGRLNAFIHCYLAVRRIATLYDLSVEICRHDGVEDFSGLGLGPLAQHPLIVHYFALGADIVTPFKISTEQIIAYLNDFIKTCQEKDIQEENFLPFVAEKESVSSPKQLCIRIQSLRMHVGFLRRIAKVENDLTKPKKAEMAKKKKFKRKRRYFDVKMPEMEKKKSFKTKKRDSGRINVSNVNKFAISECGPKHIRFLTDSSSDDENIIRLLTDSSSDDDKVFESRNSRKTPAKKRRIDYHSHKSSGSCPYPSASEEKARLRKHISEENFVSMPSDGDKNLGGTKLQNTSKRTREAFHSERSTASQQILSTAEEHALLGQELSIDKHIKVGSEDVQLTDSELRIFIAAWKNICSKKSVFEVLKTMLELQANEGWKVCKKQHIRMMSRFFTMQPARGLLNVAVISMKMGLWNTFLDLRKQESLLTEHPYSGSEALVQLFEEDNAIPVPVNGLTTHNVIEQVMKFFDVHSIENFQGGESAKEEWFMILRKIWNCEKWLMKQLSVQEFACLGFGDFLDFLENHLSQLPQKIRKLFTVHKHADIPLVACISRSQLLDFLSQAVLDLGDDKMLTKEEIYVLLHKQFPLISFEQLDSHSAEEILDYVKKSQSHSQPKKAWYSAALLARISIKEQSTLRSHCNELASKYVQTAGVIGHMTSADALKCLLKAPMLSDLEEWSHWDQIFAPTLGRMLNWMDKEVSGNALVCLVTKSGKLLRIDGSASLDEFLESAVKCCAKQTAIQFVSIVSLYGGTHHAPIALMKSHACWALDVLVRNFVERFEHEGLLDIGNPDYCIKCWKFWLKTKNLPSDFGHGAVLEKPHNNFVEKSQSIRKTTQAIRAAARFILDCLFYLPPEFRIIAAQIFLLAMGKLSADASKIILDECDVYDERFMLHEIGFSIGILEWIKDYQVFSLNASDAAISIQECKEAKNNVQNNGKPITQCKSKLDQLEGIHCSVSNLIDKRQLVNLNDGGVLQSKAKECCFPISDGSSSSSSIQILDSIKEEDAKKIIESIRREEFGLDLELQYSETDLLKKQHARLGRALQCLSQELYSEDSHFLLELVQNADDNLYPADTEPTLAFVLESNRVVVLNNELGFTAKDIKALCDVGNSTKKGSSAGYIGHKGIGFKSVFRVTDAPEIHSNGFHVKFDITEGELGFILPTLVAPLCNLDSFSKEISNGSDKLDYFVWNTCIVLPFKAFFLEGTGVRSWVSIFADLHPSLLLFLHRLRCIIVRDSLTNSLKIMQRKDIGNGLVNVSHGKESTTWLVASKELNAGALRPGIQATEIAMAFTLHEDGSGEYEPLLEQQPVFAYLPLRAYGLKFILQGDFILPCSREEVDGDSAWNQWLLSEIPELFVRSEDSFRYLPCYQSNPGKAVTLYMSFVPLVGEVLGFFSPLPRMILSKLRASPCLPLEGKDKTWVLPCKVLRGWNNQIRVLLPDDLLNTHLGLGYLDRDVHLSDTLAAALGVHAYGPGMLIEIMKSLCNRKDALKELGLNWLGSWLVALCGCLKFQPTGPRTYLDVKQESDFPSDLCEIPFIPLSDGSYTSLKEGSIWLPFEALEVGFDAHILRSFPKLHSELRIVHSSILYAPNTASDIIFRTDSDVIVSMLRCVGIGQLSTHDVIKTHILPAMSTEECMAKDKLSLSEYLAFILLHLKSNCSFCCLERAELISELQKKAVIVTNNGYKRAGSEPLHFSQEFGNSIDMKKILAGTNVIWNEIDSVYLDFFSDELQPLNLSQWRVFFKELGVTDFVQVLNVERKVEEQSSSIWKHMAWDGVASTVGWTVNDWESPELVDILTALSSSSRNVEQCSCLLEILDNVWDDIYGAKEAIYWPDSLGEKKGKCTETSFVLQIRGHRWVESRFDGNLCFPTDLFFDCHDVKSILGPCAPYATPQVHNRKLVADIGFRTQVCVKDALNLLYKWSHSECMFESSISQMGRLYSFLWTRMDTCREEVAIHFQTNSSVFVPVPFVYEMNPDGVTEGIFLSLDQVYWRDPTGCLDLLMKRSSCCAKLPFTDKSFLRILCDIYPNLYNFFTNGCCVQESPDFDGYIRIVQNLSRIAQPSQAYKEVVQVLLKWAEDVESGRVDSKEIAHWKDCLHNLDCSVLPTIQDKWVSLHQNIGLVCWCDDVELGKQFRDCTGVYFVCLHAEGKLSKIKGKNSIPNKVIMLMHTLGIPSLSEVVVREAIYYGLQDSKQLSSLINWILPYAQRYLYKMHPEIYCSLKDSTFNNLSDCLCILVVQKLFYSHHLKGCDTLSNKRHECSCLLEGNTLYVSREADYSAIYLELSRLFFKGCVNLQLTNFLHLITIMAESGTTEEHTESFIINTQTIPKLPHEEPTWFCEFRDQSDKPLRPLSPSIAQSCLTSKKLQKCCVDDSWPPTTWFGARMSRDEAQTQAAISGINKDDERNDQTIAIEKVSILRFSANSACESDQIVHGFTASTDSAVAPYLKSESDIYTKQTTGGSKSAIGSKDDLSLGSSFAGLENSGAGIHSKEKSASEETDDKAYSIFSSRSTLCWGVPDDHQSQLTGRLGESVVYKYLTEKYGSMSVNWVNEKEETGSPFDMILSKVDGKKEFIEVKATRSAHKDWFEITKREWEFASKHSDCFTIIRVFLTRTEPVKLVMLANPIKLCQQKFIKLVILMPTNHHLALPEVTLMPHEGNWCEP